MQSKKSIFTEVVEILGTLLAGKKLSLTKLFGAETHPGVRDIAVEEGECVTTSRLDSWEGVGQCARNVFLLIMASCIHCTLRPITAVSPKI